VRLVLYTASIQDEIELAIQAGDKERAEDMEKLNDLLLPVVKGYGSEKSWTLLEQSPYKHLVERALLAIGR
jgi:hypothetical protein